MANRLVVFVPSGRRGNFADGANLLDVARKLGVDLDAACGGRGICGRCQVRVSEGEHVQLGVTSAPHHLSPFSPTEREYARTRHLPPGRRLACAATVCGNLVIDVPPESQLHRQMARKEAEARDITVDPVVRLYYVEVAEHDMEDRRSDLRRLLDALKREWSLDGLSVDIHVLAGLLRALRAGKWAVTVAVHDGTAITGIWPGFVDAAFGIAFDVGSTTVAGHLCDLRSGEVLASAGAMNPQVRFGEDVMSRVSYVMMHPGAERELTRAIRRCLDALIGELCAAAGIERTAVLEFTLAGNPIMHHLALGLDPTELGGAPFALATDDSVRLTATELGLRAHPGARAYVLPCIAGHVGADTAAMVLAEAPYESDEVVLLCDVGTNAELVLGDRRRLLAASSPTGPAFEGAHISAGQRAAPGAIERVRIDEETLEPRVKVIGTEAWSDEPGFEGTIVTGICGSGIIEALSEMYRVGIIRDDGRVEGALAARTWRVVPDGQTHSYVLQDNIRVTQDDVRQIQLAKAALHAGARLLMEHYGADGVDRIRLAGTFGSQIDPVHALRIRLVPDCPPERVTAAGNAAGTGARIALLNAASRREIEAVVRRIEKVETAMEPRFQEHFIHAISFSPEPAEMAATRRTRRRRQ